METLELGKAPLERWLASARPAMADPSALEGLYDTARTYTAHLFRAGRNEPEARDWYAGLRQVIGLALVSSKRAGQTQDVHPIIEDPHLRLAQRLDVLADLLADQAIWFEHYELRKALESPLTRESVLFLAKAKSPVTLSQYLAALNIKTSAILFTLASIRMVNWDESSGEMRLWLTHQGRLLAHDLQVEAAHKAEAN